MQTWLDTKTEVEIIERRKQMSNGMTGTSLKSEPTPSRSGIAIIAILLLVGSIFGFAVGLLTSILLGVCK